MAPKGNSLHISHCVGQEGPLPLEGNQFRIEKSATGTNSSNEHQYGPQDMSLPKSGPTD